MIRCVLAWLVGACLVAGSAWGAEIHRSARPVPGQYIVVLKHDVARRAAATSDPRPSVTAVVDDLRSTFGIEQVRYVYEIALQGFAARIPESRLQALADDPRVAYVEEDGLVTAASTQTNAPWGLDRIDQRGLPLSTTYTYDTLAPDVDVYVIDTGILTSHGDFGGRAQFGFDSSGLGPTDCNGHGTATASVAAGTNFGAAKGARIWAVHVLDCDGNGDWANIVRGVEWVAQRPESRRVGLLSVTGPPSQAADDALSEGGAFFVVAAGNDGVDACTTSPARAPAAFTVGATTAADQRLPASNFGACVDLFAPGADIPAAWNTSDTATATLSGTSLAAAHVAGAAAMYWQGHPTATPVDIGNALVAAATPDALSALPAGSPNLLLYTAGASSSCQGTPGNATVSGDATIIDGGSATVHVAIVGGTPPFDIALTHSGGYAFTGAEADFSVRPTATTTYTAYSIIDANHCPATVSGSATINVAAAPVPSLSWCGLLVLACVLAMVAMLRSTHAGELHNCR